MKYWLSLGFVPETEQLPALAREAEAAGFYGVTIADHLIMPCAVDTPYPYTRDGATFWPQETPWPDPWVAIGAMSATTTTLRLASNIYLAALRDPFSAAKAVATASVLSGGRVACGVAAGWLKEEFDTLGIDFKRRGSRLNETIAVMRKLWKGDPVSHQGDFFEFPDVLLRPAPTGGVPVWCGGGSKAALKRAARHGDGWLGLVYTANQLRPVIERLDGYRLEAGRAEEPFDILLALAERPTPELVSELEEMGVTGLISTPWVMAKSDTSSLEAKVSFIKRFEERVIRTNK